MYRKFDKFNMTGQKDLVWHNNESHDAIDLVWQQRLLWCHIRSGQLSSGSVVMGLFLQYVCNIPSIFLSNAWRKTVESCHPTKLIWLSWDSVDWFLMQFPMRDELWVTPLNSYRFPISDWSNNFCTFEDNPLIWLCSNLMYELIVGLITEFSVTLHGISSVSQPVICQSASVHLHANN